MTNAGDGIKIQTNGAKIELPGRFTDKPVRWQDILPTKRFADKVTGSQQRRQVYSSVELSANWILTETFSYLKIM